MNDAKVTHGRYHLVTDSAGITATCECSWASEPAPRRSGAIDAWIQHKMLAGLDIDLHDAAQETPQ